MSQFMSNFSDFWASWGPWISLLLVPTLITGLSISPKTAKAAGVVQQIWDGLLKILTLFSVATFKDQPGTFQLPLKMGKLLPKKKASSGEPKDPPMSSGGPAGCAALLALSLAAGSTQPGCAWWHSEEGQRIKNAVIDCSTEAIKSNSAHLLPVIMAILTGTAPNWDQQIEAFTKEMGRDAVACAMDMASRELLASVPASGSGAELTPEAKAAQGGVTKARTYVQTKGWKYAPEK